MSDKVRTLRLCIVGQRYQLDREYLSIYQALGRRFDLTTLFVDDGWPQEIGDIHDHETFDAILWFVRFRELVNRPPFRWGRFAGVRLMYDQDAYQNFSQMAGSTFLGAWPDVVRRNQFHVLLCTGRATRDNLIHNGVPAIWLPKAADESLFFSLNRPRERFCYFGERYLARAAMLRELRRHRIAVRSFSCSYFELNSCLNEFLACFICNMEATSSSPSRIMRKLFPDRMLTLRPAPEAMLKNFEVAAAGCAPVCDDIPELAELGFRDGDTAITYSDFSELVTKALHYERRPNELQAIGERAAELVKNNHTWNHRATQIESIILSTNDTQHARA